METNLIGAVATSVATGAKSYPECFWWIVLQGVEVIGLAMRTPPFRLVLSPMPEDAARQLAAVVAQSDPNFWGVNGPEDPASQFMETWCALTNRNKNDFPINMWETIYVLGDHTPLPAVAGSARKADEKDAQFLSEWVFDFANEIGVFQPEPPTETDILKRLEFTAMMIWQVDGRPVAMSGHSALVVDGDKRIGRIGPVYTEPKERGHGYGAAVTSAMIEHLESLGCTSIMLYADSDYEKSNRVYQGLGFRQVGVIVEIGEPPTTIEKP